MFLSRIEIFSSIRAYITKMLTLFNHTFWIWKECRLGWLEYSGLILFLLNWMTTPTHIGAGTNKYFFNFLYDPVKHCCLLLINVSCSPLPRNVTNWMHSASQGSDPLFVKISCPQVPHLHMMCIVYHDAGVSTAYIFLFILIYPSCSAFWKSYTVPSMRRGKVVEECRAAGVPKQNVLS